MKALLGRKIGMTQIFTEEGDVVPVTVIEAGPETVTQVKTMENDGYEAVQIGFEDQKAHRVTKPMAGHFEKAGVSAKKVLAEFRPEEGESYEVGQVITVADFEEGARLDITGTSKGKGTQGNIKRHGHHRGPMSHGSKHKRLQGALAGAALALMLPLSGATREAEPFARLLVFPALLTAGVIAWQYLCSVGESLPLLDRLATADPRVLAAEGAFAAYLAVHCFRIREREE
jgi:large subunit ribosomal protein L3